MFTTTPTHSGTQRARFQRDLVSCASTLALLVACGAPAGNDPSKPGASGGGSSGGSDSSAGGSGLTTGGSSGGSTAGGSTAGGSSNPTGGGGGSDGGNGGSPNGGSSPGVVPNCPEGSSSVLPETAPELTVGTWVNISPPGVPFDASASAVTQGMDMDRCNPGTLYVCVRFGGAGIYKTTDGGGTWNEAGAQDGCIGVRTDPSDPMHVYSGDGVGSSTDGFYYSTDGGDTWTMPQGFIDFANEGGSYDVYSVELDPSDYQHVLVTFHSGWKNSPENGVVESFDGGITWEKAGMPGAGANDGTDVYFLYEPSLGIGDSQTWLFGTQVNGHWRTTNSGDTWTKVSDINMQHGGGAKYYTQEGVLYISSSEGILKSTNNGESFTNVGPNGGAYLSVLGDGTHLWTGNHGGGSFKWAPESDDTNWTDFNSQTFFEGPFELALDPMNHILYGANIRAGVFALKLE